MTMTVTMPQLGETVTEGTILRWAKNVGDTIAEDEILVEISTDKVDTEIPSPYAGVVTEILVAEGTTVTVGTALVVIAETGEAVEAPTEDVVEAESALAPEPAQEPVVAESPAVHAPAPRVAQPASPGQGEPLSGIRRVLSPVVRKLARENAVDLSSVPGTGEGGRITRSDIENYIAAGPQPAVATAPQPSETPTATTGVPVAEAAPYSLPGDEVIELDRMRVRIGENMHRSKHSTAHVWTSVEVDFERVERVRQQHKAAFKAREGFSLTYLPFITRATIDALKTYPIVNSSLQLAARTAIMHRAVNIGIAVDLNEEGLVVTTMRDADGLRMVGIARQIHELATMARAGDLGLDDLTGSTFSITNPGPFGSFMSAPIINVPNVAILSTDTISKRAAVITTEDGQDMIAIRHIGYLGLTWDHRAFDGSTAVLFLRRIKENLENWDWEQELA